MKNKSKIWDNTYEKLLKKHGMYDKFKNSSKHMNSLSKDESKRLTKAMDAIKERSNNLDKFDISH